MADTVAVLLGVRSTVSLNSVEKGLTQSLAKRGPSETRRCRPSCCANRLVPGKGFGEQLKSGHERVDISRWSEKHAVCFSAKIWQSRVRGAQHRATLRQRLEIDLTKSFHQRRHGKEMAS